MFNKLSLSTVVAIATLSVGTMAQAGTIVQPTGVSTSMGDFGADFDIGNIIDQSGLSQTYTSGVDDFDTYLGLNPTHPSTATNTVWGSAENNTTGTITFDLGSILTTSRLAVWFSGNGNRITTFEVYSDNDGDFGNGGTTLLGSFNNTTTASSPEPAEVFDFTDATTQFIHFNVTGNAGGSLVQLGEVAFEEGQGTPPTTPEPSSLMGLAVIGGAFLLRKRVKG